MPRKDDFQNELLACYFIELILLLTLLPQFIHLDPSRIVYERITNQ